MHRLQHPLPPSPLKLSHKYATEVAFQIYEMRPPTHYMADDFFIPNPPLGGTFQWCSEGAVARKKGGRQNLKIPYRNRKFKHFGMYFVKSYQNTDGTKISN